MIICYYLQLYYQHYQQLVASLGHIYPQLLPAFETVLRSVPHCYP